MSREKDISTKGKEALLSGHNCGCGGNHNHEHAHECCGTHSHDEEGCCGTHSHEQKTEEHSESSDDEDHSCSCGHSHEHSHNESNLHSNEHTHSEHNHNHSHDEHDHDDSGCGCGCETTQSMSAFLNAGKKSNDLKKQSKNLAHNHSHSHDEHSGCGCGCETTQSMSAFLNSSSIHNEHNHKHDENCNCTCDYCESMRAFLIDKHEHSHHGHDHDHNHELGNLPMIIISVVFFLAAFVLERVAILPNAALQRIIMAVLALISYVLMGHKTIINAYKNLKKGDWFGESFLMTVATFGAIAIGEYPEAAAVMLLYNIGEYFQSKAVDRSRRSISELMDIRPDFANLYIDGNTKVVAPDELRVGDIILIKGGEKVPVDSTIIEGSSAIDNKALTGESMPVEVSIDDKLLSGSINVSGLLKARVDRAYANSTVSKILELVQNASEKKSTQEKFITRFSKIYTPIVVALAIIIAFVVPFVIGASFTEWFKRSLIFLVISCPCALVISVPLSFFAGIGGASRRGILFKGSSYVEQLSEVKSIMFDKTGTLTKGKFEVSEVQAKNGYLVDEVLEKAAIAEYNSNHPIAKSIVLEYQRRTGKNILTEGIKLEEISGFGIKATIGQDIVLAGNAKLMDEYKVNIDSTQFDNTVVYIAKNNELMGIISIEDTIKKDSKDAISKLNNLGIDTVMLTGDNERIAKKVADNLGIKKVFAELLPQNKVEKVEEVLAKSSSKVAFVGDGINDAPVLARADVGIAMGGVGSDAAIEAADIVLMTDEPSKIAEAIKISKKTMTVAKQNIVFALGIKIVVMVLGVLGIANMWLAVFADVGVSIIAVFNAMRAYRTQK